MKAAIIGSGLMGRAAVYDISRADGVEKVGLFDFDAELADEIAKKYGNDITESGKIDAGNEEEVRAILEPYDVCISAVTYKFNPSLTRAAIDSRTHFFDLGGNNDVVKSQFEMHSEAEAAGVTIIPDCGLAPGMVSVLAANGLEEFDKVDSLKIRVGGLPQNPRPPLNYQIVFSSEGLLNEYWEPVVILEDGRKKIVNPMTGLEDLEFDGIGKFEAFYTSGGTSTLPDTYQGKIDSLDYKTIRYPGHCELFKPMLELGLASRRELSVSGVTVEPREVFKKILEKNLSYDEPDLVLVRLTFEGTKGGNNTKRIYEIIDRKDSSTGLTAMMRMTSFPVSIIAWMTGRGKIDKKGVIPQEIAVDPLTFITQLKRRGIYLNVKEE